MRALGKNKFPVVPIDTSFVDAPLATILVIDAKGIVPTTVVALGPVITSLTSPLDILPTLRPVTVKVIPRSSPSEVIFTK